MRSFSKAQALFFLLVLCKFPTLARAETASEDIYQEQERPIVVVVEEATRLDSNRTRQAIEEELGIPAIPIEDPRAMSAMGTLTITSTPSGRFLFVFHQNTGEEVRRIIEIDGDPDTVFRAIALLAGNLARDQTSEILSQLQLQEPEQETAEELPEPQRCQCENSEEGENTDDRTQRPSRRIRRQRIRGHAWADPLSWGISISQAFTSGNISTRYETSFRYRWLRGAFGTSISTGKFQTCTRSGCAEQRQHSLLLVLDYRRTSGPTQIEFGMGLGARCHSINGQFLVQKLFLPLAEIHATLVIPLVRGIDMFLQSQFATTIFALVPDEEVYGQYGAGRYEIVIGLGLRFHM